MRCIEQHSVEIFEVVRTTKAKSQRILSVNCIYSRLKGCCSGWTASNWFPTIEHHRLQFTPLNQSDVIVIHNCIIQMRDENVNWHSKAMPTAKQFAIFNTNDFVLSGFDRISFTEIYITLKHFRNSVAWEKYRNCQHILCDTWVESAQTNLFVESSSIEVFIEFNRLMENVNNLKNGNSGT